MHGKDSSTWQTSAPAVASGDDQLSVALYDGIPVPEAFHLAVSNAWSSLGTGIELQWSTYNPYAGPPPPTLDVFAFDCIYVDDLVTEAAIDPIFPPEIQDGSDLMDFAVQATLLPDGQAYAGIPYLGCTNVLFSRRQAPVAGPGFEQAVETLGVATWTTAQPPPASGLLVDLSGRTTDSCLYVQMAREHEQSFWPTPFPTVVGPLSDDGMTGLQTLAKCTSPAQALYQDSGYERTGWFINGFGQALVGLTETMSSFSPAVIEELVMIPLPVAPASAPTRLEVYADAVGIRPGLGAKRAAAVMLANVVASTAVGVAAIDPPASAPQYLTPARTSVLAALRERLPVGYGLIASVLDGEPRTPFRIGPGVRTWTGPTGTAIKEELFPTPLRSATEAVHPRWHTTPAGMWRRGD